MLARTSRVVKDESKLLDELGASLDQIVAEGMDGGGKAQRRAGACLCQSKSKVTSGGVWIATAGGLFVGGLVAGVLLNNVGDPRLHERRPTLSRNTSWSTSSAVERRNRLNLIEELGARGGRDGMGCGGDDEGVCDHLYVELAACPSAVTSASSTIRSVRRARTAAMTSKRAGEPGARRSMARKLMRVPPRCPPQTVQRRAPRAHRCAWRRRRKGSATRLPTDASAA